MPSRRGSSSPCLSRSRERGLRARLLIAALGTAAQVGRIVEGGASGIGWATSVDGGATWGRGLLPEQTIHQAPPGPYSRVSDPSVGYDRVHAVWIVAALALRNTDADPL